jgi:hypothetical protein
LTQPQTDKAILEVQRSAPSLPLPKSADLEVLLSTSSLDDLKKQCENLKSKNLKKLKRLQMAESILFEQAASRFQQAASRPRQQPVQQGKVLYFNSWLVVW